MTDSLSYVALRYAVRPALEAWVLPEGPVPESVVHDEAAEAFKLVLKPWAEGLARPVRIAQNLAIRWLEHAPRVGIDPDVCVLDPAPADAATLDSLCLWRPGHSPPTICCEIVSARHPHKDYRDVHERYAALGTCELVVFDPMLAGPPSLGGPVSLQLWRRDASGAFERVYAGPGPVYSEMLEAWLHAADRLLAVSNDRAGKDRWATREERERKAREELERKVALLERR